MAEVRRIVIDETRTPDFDGATIGDAGPYETIRGRAFGELDPSDPLNAIIPDLELAPRNERGNVEYVATFQIQKPVDLARSSRLLWHEVPNRGHRGSISEFNRRHGDISLSSGWPGDNVGYTGPDLDDQRLRRGSDRQEQER